MAVGAPLTELHPVPLAERVHVATQVVQHPGGQLVDVAGHGWPPGAGGQALGQVGQRRREPGSSTPGAGGSHPATASRGNGRGGALGTTAPQRPRVARHYRRAGASRCGIAGSELEGKTVARSGEGTRLRTHERVQWQSQEVFSLHAQCFWRSATYNSFNKYSVNHLLYARQGLQGVGDT